MWNDCDTVVSHYSWSWKFMRGTTLGFIWGTGMQAPKTVTGRLRERDQEQMAIKSMWGPTLVFSHPCLGSRDFLLYPEQRFTNYPPYEESICRFNFLRDAWQQAYSKHSKSEKQAKLISQGPSRHGNYMQTVYLESLIMSLPTVELCFSESQFPHLWNNTI